MPTTTEARRQKTRQPPSNELDRFRRLLQRGVPGPYAYVLLLGLDTFDPAEVLRVLAKGLPYRVFDRFRQNSALSSDLLTELVGIPRRTLTRRKREGRFLPEESDRLLRAARLFAAALELFEGDRNSATLWLTTAQPALGGAVPLDVARTDVGAREVERLVSRLEHGVFS